MTVDDPTIDPALADAPVEEPEPFTLPEDFATQVQSWDIPIEKIPEAVQMLKALETEEGTIDAFIATGQRLGFGLKDLDRLFQDEPVPAPVAPAAPAPEPSDPDRLMTAAEVQEMIAEVRKEQETFAQGQQQREQQARQAQVFGAIEQWFDSNDISDEQTRRQVATFAEKHILPNQDSYDPRVSLAALERGKADYETWVEAEAQRYLKAKGLVAQAQPTPPGGGQAFSGEGNGEAAVDYSKLGSKALDTARERVRQRLRESGELG